MSDLVVRIWAIREFILKLEEIKDEIIEYLEKASNADSVWITDTKEAYFSIVASWQMLNACLEADSE